MSGTDSRFLTHQEERELIERVQRGDSAAERVLVERNEGLLHILVKELIRSADPAEAMQEARLAVVVAARKFDLNRTTRLITYARWYVTLYVLNFAERVSGAPILVTGNQRLESTKGTPLRALADRARRGTSVPIDDIRGTLEEPSVIEEDIDDARDAQRLRREVTTWLAELPPTERMVIERLFLVPEPEQMADIARDLGNSREWVRQLRNRGIARLKRAAMRQAAE